MEPQHQLWTTMIPTESSNKPPPQFYPLQVNIKFYLFMICTYCIYDSNVEDKNCNPYTECSIDISANHCKIVGKILYILHVTYIGTYKYKEKLFSS